MSMNKKVIEPGFDIQLFKTFLGVGKYKYAGEILLFLSSLVLSRYLLPEEYGIIVMITIFWGFFSRFTDSGLSEAIIREPTDARFLQSAHLIFIIKGILVALLMAAISFPVALFFKQPQLLPVGLTYAAILFLYAFPKAAIASMRKQERLEFIAKAELVVVVFHVSLSIALAARGYSYWSLVIPHLLSPFLYGAFYWWHLSIPLSLNKSALRTAWGKVKGMVYSFGGVNFVQYWEQQADIFFVGRIYGADSLGLYNRAYTLVNLPMNLLMPQLNYILLPMLAKANFGSEAIREAIRTPLKGILALSAVPFSIFLLVPHWLAAFLWGEEWRSVGDYLGVLCILILLQGFLQFSKSLFIVFRQERRLLIFGVISGVVNMLMVVIGILHSIELMMYLLVAGTLFINVPLCMYLGYYKSFGFTASQLANILVYNYGAAVLALVLLYFQMQEYLYYPVVLVLVGLIIRAVELLHRSFIKVPQ
jgi:teichuronic acid exporter